MHQLILSTTFATRTMYLQIHYEIIERTKSNNLIIRNGKALKMSPVFS